MEAFERQWHLGGGVGVAASTESSLVVGPALGAFAAYGLSDAFDVRLQLVGTRLGGKERAVELFGVSGGLAYRLDVLRWVPYVGAEIGYYRFFGGTGPEGLGPNQPGVRVDLGLDYLLSPSVGLGFELSYHGFLGDPLSSLGEFALFTGLLRAEYHWGW